MDSGKLDQLVYLEYQQETNNSGSLVTTWVDASGDSPPSPVWARVLSQKGNEAFESARQSSRQLIRVQLRWRDDVQSTWRVTWEGQSYNIIDMDRTQRRQGWLWLTCESVGAQ